eukprot:TRINITY_DN1746_c0_g1_i1.p1 TRINITY_DN1746_c0_g1~~TRINITY_DN1746_c0_g1_i1.p1  ORF type:complete len:248 (-),score=61.52 TRINITY_DN1746_c0_g1_i1:114-857(-)
MEQRTPTKTSRGESAGLVPLTARMALNARLGDDEVFTYEGIPLVQITLVGLVTEVNTSESRKEFTLDDGTGIIKARIWTSGAGSAFHEMVEMCREGLYAHVFGHIKEWDGEIGITAFSICALSDTNEITYHFADVMSSYKTHKEYLEQKEGGGSSLLEKPADRPVIQMNEGGVDAFSAVQTHVLSFIREAMKLTQFAETGPGKEDIIGHLGSSFSERDILTAIDYLLEEGLVYISVDDFHYKATDEE